MKKNKLIAGVVVFILLGVVGTLFGNKSSNNKQSTEVLNTEANIENSDTNTNENGITPLQDFDYIINGTTLVLNKYKGENSIINIANEYEVDGTTYKIDNVEGSMFLGMSVKTVIFSDGIQGISHAFFNSSKVEKIYIPTSFTNIYDDTLAYISRSLTDIYYGGTQEQWNQIFTHYDPDTVSENLKEKDYSGAGEAAADKLNKIIGHDFDPSTVQFHFEASSGDLLK